MSSADEFVTCPSCGHATIGRTGQFVICPHCGGQASPRSPGARLVLLDSNAYDPIVDNPSLYRSVDAACRAGRIELLLTHVQSDELMRIPDPDRRRLALSLPHVVAATYGMILDVSRLGMARLGEPERIEAIRNHSVRHSRDALLASTAQKEGAVLVTNERRLTNFARRAAIEVWSAQEFFSFLEAPADGDRLFGDG